MIFVKNSRGGREVAMINTVSKIKSKIGWEGGGSTSIWIMSLNILVFFWRLPLRLGGWIQGAIGSLCKAVGHHKFSSKLD